MKLLIGYEQSTTCHCSRFLSQRNRIENSNTETSPVIF